MWAWELDVIVTGEGSMVRFYKHIYERLYGP
jgi:hypothetical protein